MDSQQQQDRDLRDNDLEQFLEHFPQWWSKYGLKTLVVILALVAGFTGWRLYSVASRQGEQRVWNDLAQATNPFALADYAANTSDPAARAQAYLRAGDLLREQALLEAPTETGQDAAAKALRDAVAHYQRVIDDKRVHEARRINARLGSVAPLESLQNFKGAIAQYEAAIEQAGEQFGALRARAEARLKLLPDIERQVVFAPPSATDEMGGTGGGPLIDIGSGFDTGMFDLGTGGEEPSDGSDEGEPEPQLPMDFGPLMPDAPSPDDQP